MRNALFVFYLVSHFTGFAGLLLIVFARVYGKDRRHGFYAIFLAAFFLHAALGNSAFIAQAFLGTDPLWGTSAYFIAEMVLSAALAGSCSLFVINLPKRPPSAKMKAAAAIVPAFPLGLLVAGMALSASGQASAWRVILMRGAAFCLAAVFALSAIFLARNLKKATDRYVLIIMKFLVGANIVLIPAFIAQSFVNYDPGNRLAPFGAENLYYFAINILNIAIVVHRARTIGPSGLPGATSRRMADAVNAGVAMPAPDAAQAAEETPPAKPHQAPREGISARDAEILSYVVQGFANKEIGARMNLSEFSVRNIVSRLLRQFGARNRVELAEAWKAGGH